MSVDLRRSFCADGARPGREDEALRAPTTSAGSVVRHNRMRSCSGAADQNEVCPVHLAEVPLRSRPQSWATGRSI